MPGVFAEYEDRNYRFRYSGSLHLEDIAAGTPANPDVLEWHLRNKAMENVAAYEVTQLAEEIMLERGITPEAASKEAVSKYATERAMTVFRRDPKQGLWIPGNNLKACLKEAANIAVNSGRLPEGKVWGVGAGKKGMRAWFPEHMFVTESKLWLGKVEADYVATSFPPAGGRSQQRGIKYTEICEDVDVEFTIGADWEITEEQWAAIWLTAQDPVHLGADRAHYGRFIVTKWAQI